MAQQQAQLFIPSKGRWTYQPTWDSLPQRWKARAALVVPETEAATYREHDPERNVIARPASCASVAETRQWLLGKGQFVIMCDDDHRFFKRLPNDWRLQRCTPEQVGELLDWVERLLHLGEVAVGVDMRQGNQNSYPAKVKELVRMHNMYGFNTSVLLRERIRFDELHVMEDMHVTLSLLERGYRNVVITEFCWNQVGGSNWKGGASSLERTPENQKHCAERLAALHAPHVATVQKAAKGRGWWANRVDVRVQWKKAYKAKAKNTSGRKRKPLPLSILSKVGEKSCSGS